MTIVGASFDTPDESRAWAAREGFRLERVAAINVGTPPRQVLDHCQALPGP